MGHQRVARTLLHFLAAYSLLLQHADSLDTWGDELDDALLDADIDSDEMDNAGLRIPQTSGSSLRRRRSQWDGTQKTENIKIEHDLEGSGTFVPAGSVALTGRAVSGSTVSHSTVGRFKELHAVCCL